MVLAMLPQDQERPQAGLGDVVWVFVTAAGVAAALTMLYLGMRSVMEIGGACAQGGPFVPRRPCPQGVPAVMVGSIWGGLILAGLYIWRTSKVQAPSFAGFLWPALFLSLGWNFFEFGLTGDPSGGVVVGWLVSGVVFALMGGLPLVWALGSIRRGLRGESRPGMLGGLTAPGTVKSTVSALRAMRQMKKATENVDWASLAAGAGAAGAAGAAGQAGPTTGTSTAPPPPATGAGVGKEDLVTRLERLDALRRSGALSQVDFERAKQALLREAERP